MVRFGVNHYEIGVFNNFVSVKRNALKIVLISKMLPFEQSFLSTTMRIGSLAVCMAAFSCAWVWRSGRGGLHGVELSCGAVTGTLFRQSCEVARLCAF